MSGHKKRILVDMDGILADTVSAIVDRYNRTFGYVSEYYEEIEVSHITSWDLTKCLPHGHEINNWFREPGFFLNLAPIPGAKTSINELKLRGFDVVVVSSPSGPISASEKIQWLHRHIPSIPDRDIFIGSRKDLIVGDALIDDNPANLEAYRAAFPKALLATLPYAYNKNLDAEAVYRPETPACTWGLPTNENWLKIAYHLVENLKKND